VARRLPYLGTGYVLAGIIGGAAGWSAVTLLLPAELAGHQRTSAVAAAAIALVFAVLYAAAMVATVLHELGHYLAARLLGVQATAVQIGTPPALARFAPGRLRVELGLLPRGRARWTAGVPAGRDAVIALAGPLADLIMAPVPLALPTHSPVRYSFAIILGATGLLSLAPYRREMLRLHRELPPGLDEALALDPSADLVAEARARLDAGPASGRAVGRKSRRRRLSPGGPVR
jgi:Zn-dependent protease